MLQELDRLGKVRGEEELNNLWDNLPILSSASCEEDMYRDYAFGCIKLKNWIRWLLTWEDSKGITLFYGQLNIQDLEFHQNGIHEDLYNKVQDEDKLYQTPGGVLCIGRKLLMEVGNVRAKVRWERGEENIGALVASPHLVLEDRAMRKSQYEGLVAGYAAHEKNIGNVKTIDGMWLIE